MDTGGLLWEGGREEETRKLYIIPVYPIFTKGKRLQLGLVWADHSGAQHYTSNPHYGPMVVSPFRAEVVGSWVLESFATCEQSSSLALIAQGMASRKPGCL